MQQSIAKEVAGLRQMRVGALQDRYAELFGEATRAGNKAWLIKRIAWRMQSQGEGESPCLLSESDLVRFQLQCD